MEVIQNQAFFTYEYQIYPDGPIETGNIATNISSMEVYDIRYEVTFEVDKSFCIPGDVLSYTMVVKNVGEVAFSNVNFYCTSYSSTIEFVTGSIIINSISYPDYNIRNSNLIDSLMEPGESSIVNFQMRVKNGPQAYTASLYVNGYGSTFLGTRSFRTDTIVTPIKVSKMQIVKTQSNTTVEPGDILTYTTTITNTGSVNALDVIFNDIITSGLAFVPGSVRINDISEPNYNPEEGFSLGTIIPNAIVTVVFDAVVD